MESNATTTNSMENMQNLESYTKFDTRDKVILHSLIEATHFNGRRAIVHEYPKVDGSSDGELYCKVRLLPDEETTATVTSSFDKREHYMKTKNMALDYPSGQKVKLYGLVGAKHLNGSGATIISYRYVFQFCAHDMCFFLFILKYISFLLLGLSKRMVNVNHDM